jgi:hypothetical protein
MRHVFKVTLMTGEAALGTRKHIGTPGSVEAFARRTRTGAYDAQIERVATEEGVRFAAHEIMTWTIGLR